MTPAFFRGEFGYFPPFLGSQAFGAHSSALLPTKPPEFDRVRVFAGIGRSSWRIARIVGFTCCYFDDTFGKLVRIARSARELFCHAGTMA